MGIQERLKGSEPMVALAMGMAQAAHKGQQHGSRPYLCHLDEVVEVLERYGERDPVMLAAGWLHDTIEDTQMPVDRLDIVPKVKALVLAITDEPGKNRRERHQKTYPKIRATPGATKLKLADRIANVETCAQDEELSRVPTILTLKGEVLASSKRTPGLLAMYRKEHPGLRAALYVAGEHEEMWAHLDGLLKERP